MLSKERRQKMEEDNEINSLILSGALEPAGIDPKTGEMLYNFTNKLKDVHPVLHREVNNMFSSHMMRLWELDMISMNVMESNPTIRLTPKAFDISLIDLLSEEELYTLKEIKRNLTRQ